MGGWQAVGRDAVLRRVGRHRRPYAEVCAAGACVGVVAVCLGRRPWAVEKGGERTVHSCMWGVRCPGAEVCEVVSYLSYTPNASRVTPTQE